ncbi:unnamed protein product [Spirodela intermedia]|uniref:3-oxo-5-alpha-steroid 4-dehydrogenase C-terminal domain-containing protein n=1 Tax=Spirodela intermedia TaxID=51605 RepID=A0A7I8IBF5_SPIIN|nr:unnamed protein product [Spirodela intermedia]CAA6655097.1 unnamed protein product [Spirodela intermedia]
MPSDESVFSAAVGILYVTCPLIFLYLQFCTVPYGRHARPGWGPPLPPAAAWFLIESPTIWLTLLLLPHGRHLSHPLALAIISPFLLHYLNRTVVYPIRLLRSGTKAGFPLSVAAVGFCFNLLNAYAQTRSVTHYAHYPPAGDVGCRVPVGMAVNVSSDLALLRLKNTAGGGYKVPEGGWFELVACPNYMGEAAEWLGWAVAASTPAALAFFLYTCANLFPRASSHRRWYLQNFGHRYPPSRKSIIPFVF